MILINYFDLLYELNNKKLIDKDKQIINPMHNQKVLVIYLSYKIYIYLEYVDIVYYTMNIINLLMIINDKILIKTTKTL